MPKALAGIGLPPAAPTAPILFGGLLWSPPVLAPSTGGFGFSYGGWLGPQGNNGLIGPGFTQGINPWAYLNQGVQPVMWGQLSKVYQDAAAKLQQVLNRNVLTLASQNVFEGAANAIGADLSYNFLAYLGMATDLVAGFANQVTAGLSTRLINWAGLSSAINPNSTAFALGSYAGQVVNIALTLFPPTAGFVIAIQTAGAALNVYDAVQSGDPTQVTLAVANLALIGLRGLSTCLVLKGVQNSLQGALGSAATVGLINAVFDRRHLRHGSAGNRGRRVGRRERGESVHAARRRPDQGCAGTVAIGCGCVQRQPVPEQLLFHGTNVTGHRGRKASRRFHQGGRPPLVAK